MNWRAADWFGVKQIVLRELRPAFTISASYGPASEPTRDPVHTHPREPS